MKARSEDQFMKNLGFKVASIRKTKGITQEQLASETGLDRVAIAYIETGKRKPKVTSIYRIALGLDVEPSELFKGL